MDRAKQQTRTRLVGAVEAVAIVLTNCHRRRVRSGIWTDPHHRLLASTVSDLRRSEWAICALRPLSAIFRQGRIPRGSSFLTWLATLGGRIPWMARDLGPRPIPKSQVRLEVQTAPNN